MREVGLRLDSVLAYLTSNKNVCCFLFVVGREGKACSEEQHCFHVSLGLYATLKTNKTSRQVINLSFFFSLSPLSIRIRYFKNLLNDSILNIHGHTYLAILYEWARNKQLITDYE